MATEKYDFLVLYNEALTKREETDDNRLSEHFTKYLVDKFKLNGKRGYFSKTDKIPGEDVFKQLSRLVKGTDKTIVVFTPGFLNDCWKKYCHRSAFKQLIDQDKAEKLIPISLCLKKEDIVGVEELNISTWVVFEDNYRMENDDNENNWNLIERALNSTDSPETPKRNDGSSHVTAQETGDNRLRTSGNALVAQPSNEFFNDALIMELASSFPANWIQLCILLGLNNNKAKEIERNHPRDCLRQAFEGITYALKNIGSNYEEQFNNLIKAFTQLRRNDLIQSLKEKYKKYQDQNSRLIDGENVSGVDIRGTSSSGDIQDGVLPGNQEQEILYERRSNDIHNVSQECASTAREIREVTHTKSIKEEKRSFTDTMTMDAGPSVSLPLIPHLLPKSHEIPGVASGGNGLQEQLTIYENQHSISSDNDLSFDCMPLTRDQEDRQPLDSSALDNVEMLDLKSLQQDTMSPDSGLESNPATISSVDRSIDEQLNYAIGRSQLYDGEIDNTPATEEDVTPALSPEIDSEMPEVTIEGAMCGNDQFNSASQNQNTIRDRILSSNTIQSAVSFMVGLITRPEYAYN